MRVVAAGGGVMNSITLSGLDNVSGKKDVGDLFTFQWLKTTRKMNIKSKLRRSAHITAS